MKITIAERLKPFCHLPGASCAIPWSSWEVQAFPALLKFENLITFQKLEYRLNWKGPVLDFTVELDLEKGVVWVYGRTEEGHRRVCIEMTKQGIDLIFDKEKKKETLPAEGYLESSSLERLSLGMSKALDWELVRRRHDMAEVLPVWFRLGQMVPCSGEKVGTAALLQECEKLDAVKTYLKVFLAGFEGILAPRLTDRYQGIVPEGKFSSSPLILLAEGARYIRSLFFNENSQKWNFLPCLPPEFHAGRFLQLQTKAGDKIDFEWSKKLLRRVVIHPAESREVLLSAPKPLKSCRLNAKKGRHSLEQPLSLKAGQTIFLDRFEK